MSADRDSNRCIICSKGSNLTSIASGCEKVRRAADLRKDDIFTRISHLKTDELFSYHMSNNCYKSYTDKNKAERAAKKVREQEKLNSNVAEIAEQNEAHTSASTPNIVTRSKLYQSSGAVAPGNVECIICCSGSFHDQNKYRICERDRANRFLEITRYNKDDVFTRTSHLQTADNVFAADLYYHKNCLRT